MEASGTITWDATANPQNGSLYITFASVKAGDEARFTQTDTAIGDYETLRLWFRPAWVLTTQQHVLLTWYDDGVSVGNTVAIQDGSYGLDDGLADWQLLAIPLADFGSLGATVDDLRVEIHTTGNRVVNFWLDNIELQGGIEPPSSAADKWVTFITGDGTSTTADNSADVLTVADGTGISSTLSGDTLTISAAGELLPVGTVTDAVLIERS